MKTSKSGKSAKGTVPKKLTHEEISHLAYARYVFEGRPEGKELEHWFNAESMNEANFGYGKDHTEHDFYKN